MNGKDLVDLNALLAEPWSKTIAPVKTSELVMPVCAGGSVRGG